MVCGALRRHLASGLAAQRSNLCDRVPQVNESRELRPGATASSVTDTVTRAVLMMSASQLAIIAAGFITSVCQARLLGATGRGDVTRFANASALSVLYFGLGINSALTYFVASGTVEPRALRRLLTRLYAVLVVLVVACTSLASVTPLRRFLPHDLSMLELVAALSAFFAASQLSSWLAALRVARADFTVINASAVAVSVTGALVSTALLWTSPGSIGPRTIIALLVGLEALRAAILALLTLRRFRPSTLPEGRVPASRGLGLRELLGYSLLTYAGAALQFLTYRLDMWVVDAWRGAAELGRYSLAVSLAQMVWIVPAAASRVVFPYSAMLDRVEAARLAWRIACLASLVSALVGVVGLVCAHLFLTVLFGADFSEVPALLGILLLGVVPYSLGKVLSNHLAGINAVGTGVWLGLGGFAITVLLDFALIPIYGATGAAWATAISYTFCTGLVLVAFSRKSSLPLRAMVVSPFKRP